VSRLRWKKIQIKIAKSKSNDPVEEFVVENLTLKCKKKKELV